MVRLRMADSTFDLVSAIVEVGGKLFPFLHSGMYCFTAFPMMVLILFSEENESFIVKEIMNYRYLQRCRNSFNIELKRLEAFGSSDNFEHLRRISF